MRIFMVTSDKAGSYGKISLLGHDPVAIGQDGRRLRQCGHSTGDQLAGQRIVPQLVAVYGLVEHVTLFAGLEWIRFPVLRGRFSVEGGLAEGAGKRLPLAALKIRYQGDP